MREYSWQNYGEGGRYLVGKCLLCGAETRLIFNNRVGDLDERVNRFNQIGVLHQDETGCPGLRHAREFFGLPEVDQEEKAQKPNQDRWTL